MALIQDYAVQEEITFSQTTVGLGTVTLTSGTWDNVSGLRAGYRFLLDSGEGEAILTEDPVFQSGSLEVNILLPLLSLTYPSGDWSLRVPRTKEVKDYLTREIKTTKLLPEYYDSLQNVAIDELHDGITRLRNIRRWNVMDQEYLDVFLQTLGITFQTDEFDIETRRRFVKEFPAFTEISGTRFFLDYLSFTIGAQFTMDHLWSNNYKDFVKREDIPGGDETGWYPTNHIQLNLDTQAFGVISTKLIVDMFYLLASVPLVLDRINQDLLSESVEISVATLGNYETYFTAEDTTP